MKKLIAISCIVLALALGTAVWLNARNSPPASSPPEPGSTTVTSGQPFAPTPGPTIGTTIANPTIIAVNTPTAVTVTSVITDPAVIPTGVNLLRISANGASTVMGQLHDDGMNGDAVAGDKTFTLVKSFNETTTGEIKLQVSAAFRGILRRVTSGIITIEIGSVFQDQTLGVTFVYPANWSVSETAGRISVVSPSTAIALSRGQVETPLDITVMILSNPSNLDIGDFADGREGFAYYASKSSFQINGRSAIRYSDVGSPVGHAPMVATFISDGSRVLLFTLNPYANDSNISMVPIFDALVASVHIP